MQTPLRIAGPDFHLTDEIKSEIRERAAKLDHLFDDIISCRVAVEAPVGHHRKGGPYNVRIDLVVPDKELVATHRNGENLQAGIREAFEAIELQLVEYKKIRTRPFKRHIHLTPPRGIIIKLLRELGYGFIGTSDGREIYFHRNSVMEPGFDKLDIGTPVRFNEEQGADGPQASTVHISDKDTDDAVT
jgi:cold shock CspA family protein/ribosome-associated translation inhibitor RaiA